MIFEHTEEMDFDYQLHKKLGNNRDLHRAYFIIKKSFNENVINCMFKNNMSDQDIMIYAEICNNNKKAASIEKFLKKKNSKKCISKYTFLFEIKNFLDKEFKINLPLEVIIEEIKCKKIKENNVTEGEMERFFYYNFKHDKEFKRGDFQYNGIPFEIKINGARLRGSNGFGCLSSVRFTILDYLLNNNFKNKEIQKLSKQNKDSKQGHLSFFPMKKKRCDKKEFFIPKIYNLLTSKEKEHFENVIVNSFCNNLYQKINDYEKLKKDLKKLVKDMVNNNLNVVDNEWLYLNAEYYWMIEGCPYFILLNQDKDKNKYYGIYITNDIEEFKKHIEIESYPNPNSGNPRDQVYAFKYKNLLILK